MYRIGINIIIVGILVIMPAGRWTIDTSYWLTIENVVIGFIVRIPVIIPTRWRTIYIFYWIVVENIVVGRFVRIPVIIPTRWRARYILYWTAVENIVIGFIAVIHILHCQDCFIIYKIPSTKMLDIVFSQFYVDTVYKVIDILRSAAFEKNDSSISCAMSDMDKQES